MTKRRLTSAAVLLAAVLAIEAGNTKAQDTARIAIRSDVSISTASDRVVVTAVSASTHTFATECMAEAGFGGIQEGGTVVAVDSTLSPAATSLTAYYSKPLPAGTQLVNLLLVWSCNEPDGIWNVYEGTIFAPRSSEVALIITPAGVTLTADHEGVVGTATDEFGIANAICVKQGSPTIKTAILTDIPLEAGDRLTEFVELDHDPETGETLYGCWVEH